MAFQPVNLVLLSTPRLATQPYGIPQWWAYQTTDNMATVTASGYFNIQSGLLFQNGTTTFFVGDLIYCQCSDGILQVQIATLLPNITVVLPNADIAPGTITTAMLGNGIVTLAKLSATVAPQSIIKYSAKYTTVGGAAAEAITISGALATDLAFVQLVAPGSNTVSVNHAVMTSNTLTVTFSADPGNTAIINYIITRAAS